MRSRSTIPYLLFGLAAGVGCVTSAAAQARPDEPVMLRGIVYDSLITSAPLQNAEVWLEGTNRSVRTDARGRFEFPDIRPGRYTLTFFHPILDSTRISAPPLVIEVGGGGPATATLTTPSAAVVHRAFCPRDPRQNTGVVLGLVRDGATGQPLANIPVVAEWTEFALTRGNSRWEPRSIGSRSDSAGRVVLCTVPTDVQVLFRGQSAEGPAGFLALDLSGRPFGRVDLELAAKPGSGTVIGVVRRRDGQPVPTGSVVALGTEAHVETDPQGRFTLTDVPVGSRILEARSIGYRPERYQLAVRAGEPRRVEIVIGDSVQTLEAITVTAATYLDRVGFNQRRKTVQGHYLDEEDFKRSAATRTEELFRLVPGVRLNPRGMGYTIEMQRAQGQIFNPRLRNYCAPSYFIDGNYFPLPPNQNVDLPMVPAELLAVEIYSNIFSAPLQFQRRDSGCGVILIWTKRGVPNRPS